MPSPIAGSNILRRVSHKISSPSSMSFRVRPSRKARRKEENTLVLNILRSILDVSWVELQPLAVEGREICAKAGVSRKQYKLKEKFVEDAEEAQKLVVEPRDSRIGSRSVVEECCYLRVLVDDLRFYKQKSHPYSILFPWKVLLLCGCYYAKMDGRSPVYHYLGEKH